MTMPRALVERANPKDAALVSWKMRSAILLSDYWVSL